jgi:hypothetical protein
MENIDDFMRDKFSNDDPAARFGFREEYWNQALLMIQAEEAGRKRRRVIWWWWVIFGLLLLVSGGLWSIGYFQQNLTPVTPNAASSRKSETGNLMPGETTRMEGSDKQLSTGHSREKDLTENAHKSGSHTGLRGTARLDNASPKGLSTPVGDEMMLHAPDFTPSNKSNLLPDDPTPLESVPASYAPQKQPYRSLLIREFEFLPVLNRAVASDPHLGFAFQPVSTPQEIIPVRKAFQSGIQWMVEGAPAWYLGIKSANAIGLRVGVMAMYQFKPHWAFSLGLGLRSMPAGNNKFVDTSNSVPQTVLKYDFGYRREVFTSQPRSLFAFEIPVCLHFLMRKTGFELGVIPQLYTGASIKQAQESSSSLSPVPVITSSKYLIKSNTSFTKRMGCMFDAGGHINVWKNLELFGLVGTQVSTGIGKVSNDKMFDASFNGATGLLDLKAPSGVINNQWWIEAGIRIHL